MANEAALKEFYPFLHGVSHDPDAMDARLRQSVAGKAEESREVNARFFEAQGDQLIAAARALADVFRQDGKLYAMGNGGSSCDASHIAVEFVHPVTAGRPALPAVSLVSDLATITAVGNDVGLDHIFVRQLIAHARPGDALIGISTSGNSANLIAAFRKAKEMGLTTFGLSGADGGQMKQCGFVDHLMVAPSTSVHRIQECHVALYHILWDLVHTLLADDRGSAASGRNS